jgi:type II secretory pathway pseudopilin PulG
MTLVEVIVALSILGGAMMGLAVFTVRLSQATTAARLRATAAQLVSDRIEAVKGAATYGGIDSLFVKTEGSITGYPSFTRKTLVTHVGGGVADTIDYRVVTVEVNSPRLPTPVRKTTVIAPF